VESGGAPDPSNIFDLFGGGGGRGRGQRAPQKPEPITKSVEISLSDVWSGPSKVVMCKIMSASERTECMTCDGRGVVMQQVRAGPGMIMQTQRPCPKCGGQGVDFTNMKKTMKKVNVNIPHGVKHADKIKISGEGHSLPQMERGDIIISVRVKKHPVFERLGADLAMKKDITLLEALCGYSFKVVHVSGAVLTVKSAQGEVVSPNQLRKIEGWGLKQKNGGPYSRGHLYVKFNIKFPVAASIKPKMMKDLRSVLGKLEYPASKVEKVTLGVGVRVKLVNLNNAEFNGKNGTIIASEQNRGRWALELENGKQVAVPERCLQIVEDEPEAKSKKPKKSKGDDDMEEDEDDYVENEEVEAVIVEGEPETTPAAIKSQYDEDEDEDRRVECKQM